MPQMFYFYIFLHLLLGIYLYHVSTIIVTLGPLWICFVAVFCQSSAWYLLNLGCQTHPLSPGSMIFQFVYFWVSIQRIVYQ